jgi:hypothetical protein
MKPSSLPFPIVKVINKGFDAVWWVWSQAVNCWLWITKYRGALYGACYWLALIKEHTYTLNDIQRELKAFHWTEDKYLDYFPWVRTLAASGFRDDCDGAAVYGGFLLSCIGIKSRKVKLISTNNDTWNIFSWYCHIVQISSDNKWMVSNSDLIEITSDDWKGFVKAHFAKNLDFYDWVI